MSSFLSPAWFDEVNKTLTAAGAVPVPGTQTLRVVFELDGAPKGLPHAVTITFAPTGASIEPGDHLGAHTMLRLRFDDARRLARGELNGSDALREGRLKLRGEVNGLTSLLDWLVLAHPSAH